MFKIQLLKSQLVHLFSEMSWTRIPRKRKKRIKKIIVAYLTKKLAELPTSDLP